MIEGGENVGVAGPTERSGFARARQARWTRQFRRLGRGSWRTGGRTAARQKKDGVGRGGADVVTDPAPGADISDNHGHAVVAFHGAGNRAALDANRTKGGEGKAVASLNDGHAVRMRDGDGRFGGRWQRGGGSGFLIYGAELCARSTGEQRKQAAAGISGTHGAIRVPGMDCRMRAEFAELSFRRRPGGGAAWRGTGVGPVRRRARGTGCRTGGRRGAFAIRTGRRGRDN